MTGTVGFVFLAIVAFPIASGLGKAARKSVLWRLAGWALFAAWIGLGGAFNLVSDGSPVKVDLARDTAGVVKDFSLAESPVSLSVRPTGVAGSVVSFADSKGLEYSLETREGVTRARLVPEARWLFRDWTFIIRLPRNIYLVLRGWTVFSFLVVSVLMVVAFGEGREGRTMMLSNS